MVTIPEQSDTTQRAVSRDTAKASWPRLLWLPLLALCCVVFSVYGGYRYITMDPSLSRVPVREDVPFHYPLLTTHVLTGAVALLLAWTQVWPWLCNNHPRIHRRTGWVYYLAGVIPSGLLAFPVAVLTPAGQGIRLALLAMAIAWVTTTAFGLRAAVQGNFEEHRRWMLRNVAMSTTIITSRVLGELGIEMSNWLLRATYDDKQRQLYEEMNADGLWAAITVHLLFVEWYLLRPRRRRRPAKARTASGAQAVSGT
jgi:hypothetical protein